jgi:hypothetical protein
MANLFHRAPSYWRLLESGAAPFPQSQALALINFFATKQIHIDLIKLSIFFIGAEILGKIDVEDENVLRERLNFLSGIPALTELLETVVAAISFEGNNKERRRFEETVVYNAMRDFLEINFVECLASQLVLSLEGVSPSGIAILRQLHANLLGRKFADEG